MNSSSVSYLAVNGIVVETLLAQTGDNRISRHEAVAQLAYKVWQSEGEPQGQDVAHWYAAQNSLNSSLQFHNLKITNFSNV